MVLRPRLAAAAISAGIALSVAATLADDAAVARVGSETITRESVEARARAMPPYQLSRVGKDAPAIARALVDQMVRASLLAQGARADGVADDPAQDDRIRSILASALLNDIRDNAAAESVTAAEVEAFYQKNRARYAPERRIRIQQITVDSREKAEALLETIASDAEYRKDPVAGWEKLVREHSIDQTSNMRAGDIGFVRPDGSTPHKDVQVPSAIYAAAAKVADGEVVPEPVKVGDHWLVIQRRGSVETPARSLEDEEPTIRALLAREKLEAMRDELLVKLRKEHVRDMHPELVERIEIDGEGDISPAKRPNTLLQPRKAPGPARPQGKPGDYR